MSQASIVGSVQDAQHANQASVATNQLADHHVSQYNANEGVTSSKVSTQVSQVSRVVKTTPTTLGFIRHLYKKFSRIVIVMSWHFVTDC